MSTDDLIRCTRCNGRKIIIGLGMLEKQCPDCIGIGWLAKNTIDIKKPVIEDSSVTKKKRGRQPKAAVLQCAGE